MRANRPGCCLHNGCGKVYIRNEGCPYVCSAVLRITHTQQWEGWNRSGHLWRENWQHQDCLMAHSTRFQKVTETFPPSRVQTGWNTQGGERERRRESALCKAIALCVCVQSGNLYRQWALSLIGKLDSQCQSLVNWTSQDTDVNRNRHHWSLTQFEECWEGYYVFFFWFFFGVVRSSKCSSEHDNLREKNRHLLCTKPRLDLNHSFLSREKCYRRPSSIFPARQLRSCICVHPCAIGGGHTTPERTNSRIVCHCSAHDTSVVNYRR